MATLQSRIGDLITAIGADIKAINTAATAKGNVVYIPFGRAGTLTTFTGPNLYFPDNVTFLSAVFGLTTAPTGADAIFQLIKGAATDLYSSDPTITATNNISSAGTLTGDQTFSSYNQRLRVRCTQVGSTVAGADLTVVLKFLLT